MFICEIAQDRWCVDFTAVQPTTSAGRPLCHSKPQILQRDETLNPFENANAHTSSKNSDTFLKARESNTLRLAYKDHTAGYGQLKTLNPTSHKSVKP